MTLIEALKSGKRVRYTGSGWYDELNGYCYNKDLVLRNDWEIEEEKITISEKEFDDAYARANDIICDCTCLAPRRWHIFKEQLGFKNVK